MLRKFADDFKAFAVKGNAIDMAIGIVIGAAFNKIINSIVTDLMMPPRPWLRWRSDTACSSTRSWSS